MDSRTVSCYSIGYSERSRGYKFYDPTTKSIFETGNARFFEDVEFDRGDKDRDFAFEEEVDIPTAVIDIDQPPIPDIVQEAYPNQNNIQESPVPEEQTLPPPEPTPLRRSTRERISALPDDYIVFIQEHEFDIGAVEDDLINFRQALESSKSQEWIDAMNEEIKSMKDNDVWDLVPLLEGVKPIGCKWIFKTKRDLKGDVETYKARLVTKGYTQKEGIDYKETFSLVSSKDSFRTIVALVTHFDLELHQMDVKTTFLNCDIDETIYMVQPENFVSGDTKRMVCKLMKSIYGLKQASRQWYYNFHQVIISSGFEMNMVDDCIYRKFSGSKRIYLVLYVDDIFLSTNDIGMLHETKRFLSNKIEMKDLGDASFVLGIQIHHDRSRGILDLSQKSYIEKILKRFGCMIANQVTPLWLRETNLVSVNAPRIILRFKRCNRFLMRQ